MKYEKSKSNKPNLSAPYSIERILTESDDMGKNLSNLIKLKKKLSEKKPKLIINLNNNSTAQDSADKDDSQLTFFVQDIQNTVLSALIGANFKVVPRWCKILRPKHIKSVVLLTINNVSENDYQTNKNNFHELDELFTNQNGNVNSFPFVSSYANKGKFFDDFTVVPISHSKWIKCRDDKKYAHKQDMAIKKYLEVYKNHSSKLSSTHFLDKISRVSLLLNVEQMIKENYPLSFDKSLKFDDYVFSKENYNCVEASSPIYGLDCEMCYNIDGEMEVVWIALVDENLECLYESLVKPQKPIKSYLTNITGITAAKLKDVKTTMEQAREAICTLLPPDAILCGQSLNNDLHALKLFHPYIIDTSVIYNLTGCRDTKSSLKNLAFQFLGEKIQFETHNPVSDAKVALKLALLKLRRGLEFGDVIINGISNYAEEVVHSFVSDCKFRVETLAKFIYDTGFNVNETIFDILEAGSMTSTMIDRSNTNRNVSKDCKLVEVEDNKRACNELLKNLNSSKFLWCQLYFDETNFEQYLKNQIDFIKKVDENMEDDSIFIVVFTGDMEKSAECLDINSLNNYLKGRLFIKQKDNELDKLQEKIAELYNLVKKPETNKIET